MTAPACRHHDDGRHRWRFGLGRWAGTPYYGCGLGCPIVLPGDDVAEDAGYLAGLGGTLVAACAGCLAEVEAGDGADGYVVDLPGVGLTVVCLDCGPDEADALAELAAAREVTA